MNSIAKAAASSEEMTKRERHGQPELPDFRAGDEAAEANRLQVWRLSS